MKSQNLHPNRRAVFRRGWLALAGLFFAGISPSFAQYSDKITSPGTTTWKAPEGVTQVVVEAWGAGGRGAERDSGGGGGGGGGGAYARSVVTVVPGEEYTVIVGAGSNSTQPGGDSSFRVGGVDKVRAKGGSSVAKNQANGANGGSEEGSEGDVKYAGGKGANGSGSGGGGGGASAGPKGAGADATSRTGASGALAAGSGGTGPSSNGNGGAGTSPGGGGGGSFRSSGTRSGGQGGHGQVVIWYYKAKNTLVYNTAGTSSWKAPVGVTQITVEAIGGGGNGSTRSTSGVGGGGGGGAYASGTVNVTPGTTYTIRVGGAAGRSGIHTSSDNLDNYLVAAAGGSSALNNNANGALGGTVGNSKGTVKRAGGNGANGSSNNYGGGGGSSAGAEESGRNGSGSSGGMAPAGGGNGGNGASSSNTSGTSGSGPGGGGGGAWRTSGTRNGGAGAAGWVRITYDTPNVFEYAANEYWVVPPGVIGATVEAWGAGGRGGSRTSNDEGTGGGGGGAYSRSVISLEAGQVYTIEVGQGSTSTAAGGDSAVSQVNPAGSDVVKVRAKGGSSVNTSKSGANGGSASGGYAEGPGSVKYRGGNGASGNDDRSGGGGSSAGTASNGTDAAGQNGASAPSGGGNGGNGRSNNGDGAAGAVPGGGGGGAYRSSGTNVRNGGNGANGKVLVTYELAPPGSANIVVYDGEEASGTPRTDNAFAVDFGSVPVGDSSVAKSFTIHNSGTQELELVDVVVVDDEFHQFEIGLLPDLTTPLAPNESVSFTVIFSPTSRGTKNAVVNVVSSDEDQGTFRIPLEGLGTSPEIAVSLNATELVNDSDEIDFGSVNVGSNGRKTFTIENKGNVALMLSDFSFVGANASEFTVDLDGTDLTVAAGQTTTFDVVLSPSSNGNKSASLIIESNDVDFVINLEGKGTTTSDIAVFNGVGTSGSPRTSGEGVINFGTVEVGASSSAQVFTILNTSEYTLEIEDVSIAGISAVDFILNDSSLNDSVAPGTSTSFSVTFTPTGNGVKTAVINIESNAASANPFVIVLSGSGLVAGDIMVTTQNLTPEDNGLSGGGSVYRPMPGVINQLDQVSFKAFGKVGTGGIESGNDALLITDISNDMYVIARESQFVDAKGTLKGLFSDILITNAGQTVAFDRVVGSPAARDQLYILSVDGKNLESLSRTGDDAPGGGKFKGANRSIVTDGEDRFYFSSGLTGAGVTTKTDTGIWVDNNGTFSLLVREGEDLSVTTGDPAWLGAVSAKLSAAGDGVAFIANLQNNPAKAKEKTDNTRNVVVLSGNEEDGLEVVARKGDPVPDTEGALLTLQSVSRSVTGAHAVLALMKTGSGVTKSNDQVLISVVDGESRLVAREGVTTIAGTLLKTIREFYAVNDDEVIFLTDRAVCRWTVAGGITVLARTGASHPELNSPFKVMNQLSVSPNGAIALVSTHNNKQVALWRAMPGGNLVRVQAKDDIITVNGQSETVLGIAIHSATSAGGGGGGLGAAINDSGTVFATFSVGSGIHAARKIAPELP
jgi:hypothetical protein